MENKDKNNGTLVLDKYERGNEEHTILTVDLGVWMRPVDACEYLNNRGLNVSESLMYYWRKNGKIEERIISELGDLALVNVDTAPKEQRKHTGFRTLKRHDKE